MGFVHKALDLIPSAIASRVFGLVADHALPRPLQAAANTAFAHLAHLNMSESGKRLDECRTLNELFTRPLREGARPIGDADIVSPVDGRLSLIGRLGEGMQLDVKGHRYDAATLVGTQDPALTGWMRDAYVFIIYLSPSNYHRIHSPAKGEVTHVSYVPGRLLPVNRLGYLLADDLLPANERLTSFMTTANGRHCALSKIGATCVGRITLNYDGFSTNRSLLRSCFEHRLPVPWQVDAGEEVACFELGSTVVLFVESEGFEPIPDQHEGNPVKVGMNLGNWHA